MTPFELDIGAQPEVVAGTLAHYRGAGAASLRAAASLRPAPFARATSSRLRPPGAAAGAAGRAGGEGAGGV